MANTSASGGYLTPTSAPPAQGLALDFALQKLIAGLTGLDPKMVRPRVQPNDPLTGSPVATIPNADTDWCAVGVTAAKPDDMPSQTHHSDGDGYTILRTFYRLDVLASFYGPNGDGYAKMARDGLYVGQNREAMRADGLSLLGFDDIRDVPEIVNAGTRRRSDLPIRLNHGIERRYEIRNVLQADGTIRADASGRLENTPFLSPLPPA
jgi:hypothetical protein